MLQEARDSRRPSRLPIRTSAIRSRCAGRSDARSRRLSRRVGLNQAQRASSGLSCGPTSRKAPSGLLISAPSGGTNETAAMRAFDDVRKALRQAGIDPRSVVLETYFVNGDPSAPAAPVLSPISSPRRPIARTGRRMSAAIRRTCRGPIWAAPRSAILPRWSPIRDDLMGPRGETPRPASAATSSGANTSKGEIRPISKRTPV